MKTLYLLLITLLSYLLLSCNRILEVPLPENQIDVQEVFNTPQTAEAALANLYANLRDSSPISGNSAGTLLSLYTDELDYFNTTSNNGYLDIFQLQIIPANTAIYSYWSAAYQLIYNANAIIQGLEQSPIPLESKQRIKAEALSIRTLLFWYLHQSFGDIPLPTTTNYTVNQSLPKVNSQQILIELINDINSAIPHLANEYRNTERIYINKKTAELIKAKILMDMNSWNEAETILKDITNHPQYTFQNDITKVFIKSGAHILWQLKPKNAGDATKEATTYYFTGTTPNNIALSNSLVNVFSSNDLRKTNWMVPINGATNTWYRADKYKNRSNNTTEYSIVFRLEEVYLLLAEALTQQNKISEALPYVNALRIRASIPILSTTISKTQLLEEIVLESRREFFTEMGHRFFDLKRNNALHTVQNVKPNWQTFNQLWPIPQKELLLNPNLNPQNNGY